MTGRCSRGAWCAWRVTRWEDGRHVAEPAETAGAFCRRDEELIGAYLAGLPRAYLLLGAELGRLRTAPLGTIGGTAESGLPLDLAVDALMRETADYLISWWERVAAGASLSPPEVRRAGWYVTDGPREVKEACRVLGLQLERLLELPPEWMTRRMTIAEAWRVASSGERVTGWIRPSADYAEVDRVLGGAHAGLEVIGLRGAARRVLGETRPVPDELVGVRCKSCDHRALYRADQASAGRSDSGHYSACGHCGHRMGRGEYDTWVRQWAAWERARLKTLVVLEA